MERNEIIEYACSTWQDAIVDYPFDDIDFTVLRHKSNRKWFALLFTLNNRLSMNVKVSPYENEALCETYEGIMPGWHMNKRHWITIDVNSDVPQLDVLQFLKESYDKTRGK